MADYHGIFPASKNKTKNMQKTLLYGGSENRPMVWGDFFAAAVG